MPTPSGDLFANVDEGVSAIDVLYSIKTDEMSLVGPNSFIEYFIKDDPSGLFEIADYLLGKVTLKDGMSLDYNEQSSHVIRIETKHYNNALASHNGVAGYSSVRLFWDLTINVYDPDPLEITAEPENIYDTSNVAAYFAGTDNGNVNTIPAQYTFNVGENKTNIDIGQVRSGSHVSNVEYFFYNGTKSYGDFSLVKDSSSVATLHYDGRTDYEVENQYELELWAQIQDAAGVAKGWSKISVTINVTDDSTEAPEFYTDEYNFKLPENVSDANNGVYVGKVATKDNGDSVSYSFTDPNAVSNFTLNSTTGEIFYIGTDSGSVYSLSITATGVNGETTQTEVFITDDNFSTSVINYVFDFVENKNSSSEIGKIALIGSNVIYYIYGDNNGFSIDSTTGILSYDGEGFNHETDAAVPLTIYAVSNNVLIDVIYIKVNILDEEEFLFSTKSNT